jgi:ABC-type enterochelin transport system permease subunit
MSGSTHSPARRALALGAVIAGCILALAGLALMVVVLVNALGPEFAGALGSRGLGLLLIAIGGYAACAAGIDIGRGAWRHMRMLNRPTAED